MFNQQVLQTIFILTALSWGMVNGLITPLFEKRGWDKFYLMYVAWAISGILTFLMGLNMFNVTFTAPLVGQIVTALAGGILSNFAHDLTDKPTLQTVVSMSEGSTTEIRTDTTTVVDRREND